MGGVVFPRQTVFVEGASLLLRDAESLFQPLRRLGSRLFLGEHGDKPEGGFDCPTSSLNLSRFHTRALGHFPTFDCFGGFVFVLSAPMAGHEGYAVDMGPPMLCLALLALVVGCVMGVGIVLLFF